jgi:hypothetical protein
VATLIVLFNLKSGASRDAYERWAAERDVPTVSALTSVDSFRVLRANGLLGGGEPPYHYIEVIEINDLARFDSELANDTIRQIASEFQQFADAPVFLLAEQLALGESR